MLRTLIAAAVVVAGLAEAQTQVGAPIDPQRAERCAVRVAIALTGKSPSAALFSSPNPQMEVGTLLGSADFIERFSRFINATFNDAPGAASVDDTPYHLAKHVLTNGLPWKQLFLGKFDVTVSNNAVVVREDPNGLGYFRTKAWLERYAGNEETGVKLSTAYRMMNNTVGLKLKPAVQVPGVDFSANGRQNAACRGCHYEGWSALDKVASVLTRTVKNGDQITFTAPTAGPQQLLGRTIANDGELIAALVESEPFDFRVCRLAFEFLYGRPELSCEGPVFDRCIDAFRAEGTIQAALRAVATDATYCQ
ncbi:MAG: hypothetical protein ACOZQL_17145 [Myxococcota bacterium]